MHGRLPWRISNNLPLRFFSFSSIRFLMSQYIVQGIFAVAGIVALLAAILNWDWFFTAQNTQFVVRNVGRRQARWFYGVLGVILISMSVFFFLNTPPT